MTWVHFPAAALLTALVAGCVKTDECVWVRPMHFANPDVVAQLATDDPTFLAAVVANNEKFEQFCQ